MTSIRDRRGVSSGSQKIQTYNDTDVMFTIRHISIMTRIYMYDMSFQPQCYSFSQSDVNKLEIIFRGVLISSV